MPEREWIFRIEDIIGSIEKINRFTSNLSFDDFTDDDLIRDGVLRNLTIIGEAAKYIPGKIQSRHKSIPWDEMKAMRNFVVHEYFGVDNQILWYTITNDLPLLLDPLKIILNNRG